MQKLRRKKRWSQLRLSQKSGVSPAYLAEIERGERNPSLETILAIANAFQVKAGFLVDGIRFDAPEGLEAIAENWHALNKKKRALLVELVLALVPDQSDEVSPLRRAKRPKTSE